MKQASLMLLWLACSLGAENFRVNVDITFADAPLRARLTSRLNSELRRLGDVDVVDDRTDWGLIIVGMTSATKGGAQKGYTIAVCTIKYLQIDGVKKLVGDVAKASHSNFGWAYVMGYGDAMALFGNLAVYAGSESEIDETARDIIASFDTATLLPVRKLFQKPRAQQP